MLKTSKNASRELGVHPNTLRRWADEGKIKHVLSPGGKRLYDCESVSGSREMSKICYCRVSSAKQKDDLCRQVRYLRDRFPEHEIVEDVGSGLNFRRKGFTSILERSCSGTIGEVVVAHRDRLCRFGFDLIKWIIERNGGKLVVLDDVRQSPELELSQDLLSIIHVFSCRMHGLRKYGRAIKEDQTLPQCGAEGETQEMDGDVQIPL